jgi:hypothetical protein
MFTHVYVEKYLKCDTVNIHYIVYIKHWWYWNMTKICNGDA